MDFAEENTTWQEVGVSVAGPLLIGGAIGLAVSNLVRESARRPVAVACVLAGIASLLPQAISLATNYLNRPTSSRGRAKRLRNIRDHGISSKEIQYLDPLLDEDIVGI